LLRDDDELTEDGPAVYRAMADYIERIRDSGELADLEKPLGGLVDRLLLSEGIASTDAKTRPVLLTAFAEALLDAARSRERNATGDYSPDPRAERFPDWVATSQTAAPTPPKSMQSTSGKGAKLTLTGLLEDWWSEAKAVGLRPSTYDNYRHTFGHFRAFLKHDDATRVTPDDVVSFKDHRLKTVSPRTGKPVSGRTVNDTNLAALKSVFGWAVTNRKLPSNPAEGINVKRSKRPKLRERGFTEAEVRAVLSACQRLEPGSERPESYAAKRWVPWLLAYTGARVGEMAQLRKADLLRTGDHWSLRITPEAGKRED
jgi:hypothetical protein